MFLKLYAFVFTPSFFSFFYSFFFFHVFSFPFFSIFFHFNFSFFSLISTFSLLTPSSSNAFVFFILQTFYFSFLGRPGPFPVLFITSHQLLSTSHFYLPHLFSFPPPPSNHNSPSFPAEANPLKVEQWSLLPMSVGHITSGQYT